MAGFENDVMFAKNSDYTQADNQAPVEANGLFTNGQLWIGATTPNAGGTHINVGGLTSPNASVIIGYSSPNITLEVPVSAQAIEEIEGDTGSITGATVTIFANNVANNCGRTVLFSNSGTTSTLNVTDVLQNTLVGNLSGNIATTGANNTAFGQQSMQSLTSGNNNTGVGLSCFGSVLTGDSNTAMGVTAAQNITSGSFNTCIGQTAGGTISTAGENVCLGFNAMAVCDGSMNICIGSNTMIGGGAANNNCIIGWHGGTGFTTASNNVGLGYQTLANIDTGAFNTALGYNSGSSITASDSSNILIAHVGVSGESNVMRLGTDGSGNGEVDTTFVAGITGVTVASSAPVAVDTNGQLSSLGLGSTGQVLTSTGATSPTWQAPADSSKTTTYNTADSPATWTKDARTKTVEVYGWAGGGGAGSGRKGATTASGGGAAGGAGGTFYFKGNASVFNATETVTIGAGGSGGAAQTATADGNPGVSAGGNTSFGNMLCLGGAVGPGGTTASATRGASGLAIFLTNTVAGPLGGNGNAIAGQAGSNWGPGVTSNQSISPGAGGGGGGADTVTQRAGGNGSNLQNISNATLLAGGLGGLESTGINGTNGNIPLTTGGILSGGSGGGGGGGYSVGAGGATAGGNGGNGAIPGGGGGGGGGGITAVADSGSGGNGANGRVIVIEYF